MLRDCIQTKYGVSISTVSITSKMTKRDLSPDLIDILTSIEEFRAASFSEPLET